MKIEQLIKEYEIKNIVFNSNEVQQGDLFVAISGFTSDGHDYIEDAIIAGASAIVGQKDSLNTLPIPYYKVPNSRLALAKLTAEFFNHPCNHHTMIGITGTNGKTTTAYMIRCILEHAKQSCALFGSIERYINGHSSPSLMTTPNAVLLQQWLQESSDDHVVMEVSSHALTQSRVDGIQFDYALFTNISHEHLDYHQTFEAYYRAKAHLFSLLKPNGEAIINSSSSWGLQLAEQMRYQGIPVITYGQRNTDSLELIHSEGKLQSVMQIRENQEIHTLTINLPGFHNIMNAMAAIVLARKLSIPYPVISSALASFPGVPGRLEQYTHPNESIFIIDYAHTPDGLLHCLRTMRVFRPKRLIHLFGFRGNRDDSKWSEMVRISRSYCDQTILTLDDLNEVPREHMLKRYESLRQGDMLIIPDRTLAIKQVWNQAEIGECVLITGKGVESYQHSFELPTHSDPQTIQYLQEHYSLHPAAVHHS